VLRRFETLIDPFPEAAAGAPPTGLFAFLMHYSRPAMPWLVVMAVLTGLLSLIELWFVSFTGELVDWLAGSEPSTFFADHGWKLIAMAVVVVVVFPLLGALQAVFQFQTIFGNYPMLVRWMAHRYILGQSMSFFQDEFAGRVSQKVMQTALGVRETVTKIFDVGIYIVVYFLGTAFLLAQSDWWLLVPLLVWLVGYILLLRYFVPRLGTIGEKQADARALMTGRVVDSYTNIQTVKLFAHAAREQTYARDAMSEFLVTVHGQARLFTHMSNVLNVINSVLLAVVAAMAIYFWQQSLITLGAITVAIGLIMRLRAMSQWIVWEVAQLFESIGTVQDGMRMLAKPIAIVDRPDAKPLAVTSGEIRFERARFHYGRKRRVIEDFTLAIKPGEKVGLVGRSGAGKSTLVNLLLRFYDLEGGRILIDGQNIADVTQESLREAIGMVTQDTSLLHRSVRDNIAYGRPNVSDDEVVAAARLAHADAFIGDLADPKGRTGYAAHVGERGVKLSGGQRQRVALARIFLKDAPILVLDEATSALDSEIEAAIQESLYELMAGKTVIAIAHRLSTIAAMDRLVVLDQGRIVEMGTHEELLRAGGLYAALWNRQSGGFLDPEATARVVAEAAE
jgi:ATP-binding cassette, subfamily B, multidrug efflux pump